MKMPRQTGAPGGWRFPVSESVTLTALTPALLREKIFNWRIENAIPCGDLESIDFEIDAYYCKLYPEKCVPEPVDNQWPAGVTPEDKMSDRVVRWLATMLDQRRVPSGGWPLVSAKVAEARASACATCHRNKPFPSGCSPCDESVNRASARVRSHRISDEAHSLYGCEVFGWDTAAAVHLTDTALMIAEDDPRRKLTPPNCAWHKDATA